MKICIESQDDGTFLVGEDMDMPMDTGMAEGMPQEMAMDQSQGMQPAAGLDEALDMARQLLQDDGRSPEEAELAGYSKGARPMMAGKQTPQAVFGE